MNTLKDDEGKDLPVIQAPAVVIPAPVKTDHEKVQAVIKQDSDLEERSKEKQGQRDISDTWESTQRQIALAVTYVALLIASTLSVAGFVNAIFANDPNSELIAAGISAFVFLSNVANLVIGFYFGRTNHTKIGGMSRDAS